MSRAVFVLPPILALVLLPSNVVAASLPLLREEWAASATAMGWVVAAYQVGYVAAVLVLLPATDRVPAERVIAGSAALVVLASLLFPLLAQGVWSAALLRALAGAGVAGVYMPGVRVVAMVVSPGRRGSAVGLYVSAFYLGSALSLWATGTLVGFSDWRGAALVLGGVSLLALPLAAVLFGALPPPAGRAARLDLDVLRDGPIRRTVLAYAGHSWELYVARGWLAAFLAAVLVSHGFDTAASTAEGSRWAALIVGTGTAGVWAGGWLSDRVGRSQAAGAVALASGVISLGLGLLAGAPWTLLVAVGCVYGVVMAADSAIYSTAVTELAPPGSLGSVQAVQAFIGFLASAISPVAAGAVLDLGGGYAGAFILAGVASLGAAALLAQGVRTRAARA